MKVLVATLPLHYGGVSAHADQTIRMLCKAGHEVTVAYYLPYGYEPSMSVPVTALGRRRPTMRKRDIEGQVVWETGCWFPELEFTHYWCTDIWKRLIDEHDGHVAVCGSALQGLPFAQHGTPFLAWVGTDFDGDRAHRVRGFPILRRMLDGIVNRHVCRYLEKVVLRRGVVIPTSGHVATQLKQRYAGAEMLSPMGVPIDTGYFTPGRGQRDRLRIGFAGRLNDARKNIELLVECAVECHRRGLKVTLDLIGQEPGQKLRAALQKAGLGGFVSGLRKVSREELRDHFRRWSVFVLPSHQEGLCIAALQAMACGCAVVSTRCGGPEDYVRHEKTGLLAQADARSLADGVQRLVENPGLRNEVAERGRELVLQEYAPAVIERRFHAVLAQYMGRSAPAAPVFTR